MLPILLERKRIPQFKMDSDGIVPDVIDVLPPDIMEVKLINASVLFCIIKCLEFFLQFALLSLFLFVCVFVLVFFVCV